MGGTAACCKEVQTAATETTLQENRSCQHLELKELCVTACAVIRRFLNMKSHRALQPVFQRAASRYQTLGALRDLGSSQRSHLFPLRQGMPGAERTGHSHRATSDACGYTGSSSTSFLSSSALLTTNTTALEIQRCRLSS